MTQAGLTRRTLLRAASALPLVPLGACAAPLSLSLPAPLATALDRPDELAAALKGKRVALLTHAAGVDRRGRRSIDVIAALPGTRLAAIWSPEHGLAATAAAGDHVGDGRDGATGVPIHSLYGERRAPTPAMVRDIDAIFIDLQDVGTRPYTYASTLLGVLEVAAASRTQIWVNDRPNPLGGVEMEGPVLDPALRSFVGAWPIPLRHGMTLGELALMMNGERVDGEPAIAAPLTIFKMTGWTRAMDAEAFGASALPFIPPSPNLRSPRAMLAYAGTVLFEGTSVSEGRGTDAPFEMIGAPFLDRATLAANMPPDLLPGATLESVQFVPTTSRYKGERCGGLRMTITDPQTFRPVRTALTLIALLMRLYSDKAGFLAGNPPFFDRLSGQSWVREGLLQGASADDLEARSRNDRAAFAVRREPFLLY